MIGLVTAMMMGAVSVPNPALARPTRPCPRLPMMVVSNGPATFARLAELPDADLEVALSRTQGGCRMPLIIRYRVSR